MQKIDRRGAICKRSCNKSPGEAEEKGKFRVCVPDATRHDTERSRRRMDKNTKRRKAEAISTSLLSRRTIAGGCAGTIPD
jgi:hypothetical protein